MKLPDFTGLGACPECLRSLVISTAVAGAAVGLARSESITTEVNGSVVERIQSGGVWVPRADLRWGVSSGAVDVTDRSGTIRNADTRNLESYFVRNGNPGIWEVSIGAWVPGPGPAADFFLFEAGGNDVVQVRARFQSGALGEPVSVGGWKRTCAAAARAPRAVSRSAGVDPADEGRGAARLMARSQPSRPGEQW